MTDRGAEPVERRPRIAALWREHRARWTLPLVIIVIIGAVAIVDHLGSHRISQVDAQKTSALVPANGGAATVEFDRPWDGFNPNTPAGAASTTPTLLSAVLPSAYVMNPKLVPQVNTALLVSVEVDLDVAVDHPVRDQPQGRVVGRRPGERGRLHLRLAFPARGRDRRGRTARPGGVHARLPRRGLGDRQPRRQDGHGGVRHAVHRLAGDVQPHGAGPHRHPGRVESRVRHLQPGRRSVGRSVDGAVGVAEGHRGAGPEPQVVGTLVRSSAR